ncbi:hydroxymethylbilane synthase [Georgenia wangjunii]|uniref:hydroxymethylbilane synthase n=1 Tax=Georgenia wangjunii TaxID=3117730 RepID=UPI002F2636DD
MTSSTRALRIGTRASALAMTQTGTVADALRARTGRPVELVQIRTEGDRSTASLASLGGTGVFAAALRSAVLDGRCDLAVHSLKDLPTARQEGLTVAAVPPRADPRDALCAREDWDLVTLPHGARIGTGSPRRAAQLLAARPDLTVLDIRGNVGTRLARVAPGDLDGVVLARAGLERLGLLEHVSATLEPDVMLPAPGQGALAVECRTQDLGTGPLAAVMAVLEDTPSRLAVTAERAVLRELEAGCAAPVGAWGRVAGADGTGRALTLRAVVVEPGGARRFERSLTANLPDGDPAAAVAAADDLGSAVARALLDDGAAALAGLAGR